MTGPARTVSIVSDDDARRTELLEAALAHAARGWPVHRCKGKKPLTDDWPTAASTDGKVVTDWWAASAANIGVVTGSRSGIVVLDVDIDPEKGIDGEGTLAGLIALHGPLPDTVEARTGRGGRHLYFRHPGHPVKTRAGSLGPGLDVRGDGGQVIVPPSRHPNGTHYVWAAGHAPGEIELAEMPAWLENEVGIQRPAPGTSEAPRSVLAALLGSPAQQGQRHDWLTRVAGCYAVTTTDFELYAAEVRAQNSALSDPLPAGELQSIVNGIWAKEEVKAGAPAPWEPPLPFETFDVPTFPVLALPKVLREFVLALAEATQTPPDLAAMLSLAAVSATVAGRIEIEAREGFIEPLNIFAVVALPPANRKTAVAREVIRPLLKFERDLAEELRPQISAQRSEKRRLEKRINALHNTLAKCDDREETVRLAGEAASLQIEFDQLEVPAEPQLITDDTTPEKLAMLLYEQGGRIASMSGEASLIGQIAGRYSSTGPRVEVYLAGHAGDLLRIDRVGRDPLSVESPALTIGVAVQPGVLEGLAEIAVLRERGVLARFLFSLPVSPLGTRKTITTPLSGNLRFHYEVLLERLLSHTRGMHLDGKPYTRALHFDAEAQALLDTFQDEIEPKLGEFGELAQIAGWGGKLVGAVARIAGLLHAAADPDRPDTGPVSAATLSGALEIGRYLLAHAKAAFVLMGADKAVADAKHILRWIERNAKAEFSERDLHRDLHHRFEHSVDARPGLAVLEDRGYLRRVPAPTEKRSGRKASPRWEVNPALGARN
jgi:replicative DNA helicase